jgi:hypothetical protein
MTYGKCQWQRIATRIATGLNLSVFGPIPPRTETAGELYKQDTGGCARIPKTILGVKWSQVQILSARRSSEVVFAP